MRFTLASAVEPSRPNGVGLTALALGMLTLIHFVSGLLQLHGGSPIVEPLLMCLGRTVVLLCIWNYWKGQNWARIFVLLWSFVVAARDTSSLIDRNESLTSLMSQPLRFFHAVLAIFLLYFLNARPVRAWFKRMSATAADLIAEHLVGKLCTAVGKHGTSAAWRLAFEHDAEFILLCPWRIVLDDNLAFASTAASNPAPEFPGSPSPASASDDQQPSQLLENLRVKAVRLAPRTSDLFLSFEMGIELQSWSDGHPSQQWKFSDPTLTVVADSAGVSSQLVPAPTPSEGPAEHD